MDDQNKHKTRWKNIVLELSTILPKKTRDKKSDKTPLPAENKSTRPQSPKSDKKRLAENHHPQEIAGIPSVIREISDTSKFYSVPNYDESPLTNTVAIIEQNVPNTAPVVEQDPVIEQTSATNTAPNLELPNVTNQVPNSQLSAPSKIKINLEVQLEINDDNSKNQKDIENTLRAMILGEFELRRNVAIRSVLITSSEDQHDQHDQLQVTSEKDGQQEGEKISSVLTPILDEFELLAEFCQTEISQIQNSKNEAEKTTNSHPEDCPTTKFIEKPTNEPTSIKLRQNHLLLPEWSEKRDSGISCGTSGSTISLNLTDAPNDEDLDFSLPHLTESNKPLTPFEETREREGVEFHPSGGARNNFHGFLFHHMLITLLLFRLYRCFCKKSLKFEFWVSIENTIAGKFDDFVVDLQKDDFSWVRICMQIKHSKEIFSTLSLKDLIADDPAHKSTFKLWIYFASFIRTYQKCQKIKNQMYILYTNKKLQFGGDPVQGIVLDEDMFEKVDDPSKILNTILLKFKDKFHGRQKMNDILVTEAQKIEKNLKVTESDCDVFLKNFYIAENQNHLQEDLKEKIISEMGSEFGTRERSAQAFNKIFTDSAPWLTDKGLFGKGTRFNQDVIDEYFSQVHENVGEILDSPLEILLQEKESPYLIFTPSLDSSLRELETRGDLYKLEYHRRRWTCPPLFSTSQN